MCILFSRKCNYACIDAMKLMESQWNSSRVFLEGSKNRYGITRFCCLNPNLGIKLRLGKVRNMYSSMFTIYNYTHACVHLDTVKHPMDFSPRARIERVSWAFERTRWRNRAER